MSHQAPLRDLRFVLHELAGLWLHAAARAQDALDEGRGDAAFYMRRVLPRASGHREALPGGAGCMMVMSEGSFAFCRAEALW